MSQTASSCPKCQGEMVVRFVMDRSYGSTHVSEWIDGPPQDSFWTGIKMSNSAIPIGTFRCQSCGFLESYAREEFAAKWLG